MSALAVLLTAASCDDPTRPRVPPETAAEIVVVAAFDAASALQVVWVQALGGGFLERPIEVEALHEGRTVAEVVLEEGDASDPSSCVGGFGQFLASEGECILFPFWPEPGEEYELRVLAPGRPVAHGRLRVLEPLVLQEVELTGHPPVALSARWNAIANSHRYVVSVLGSDPDCSVGCLTGWAAPTADTLYDGPVDPDALRDAGRGFTVQVQAFDRALWDYFTTGATGSVFVVPPRQNVEGGHGVIGSRSRGWSDMSRTPLRRGEWDLRSFPPADAAAFAIDPSGDGVLYAAGDTAVLRSSDGGTSWTVELTGGVPDPLRPPPALEVALDGLAFVGREEVLMARDPVSGTWGEAARFDDAIHALLPASQGVLVATVDPTDLGVRLHAAPEAYGPWTELPVPTFALEVSSARVLLAETAPGEVWVGGQREPELYHSIDGGGTWTPVSAPQGEMADLAVGADGRLYAGSVGAGNSRGTWLWDASGDGEWQRRNVLTANVVAPDPLHPERVWLGHMGPRSDPDDPTRVLVSGEAGASPLPSGYEGGRVLAMEVDRDGRWIYLLAEVDSPDFFTTVPALLRLSADHAP